jgi:hypothetical protein
MHFAANVWKPTTRSHAHLKKEVHHPKHLCAPTATCRRVEMPSLVILIPRYLNARAFWISTPCTAYCSSDGIFLMIIHLDGPNTKLRLIACWSHSWSNILNISALCEKSSISSAYNKQLTRSPFVSNVYANNLNCLYLAFLFPFYSFSVVFIELYCCIITSSHVPGAEPYSYWKKILHVTQYLLSGG